MLRCADALEQRLDELAVLLCLGNGTPVAGARSFDCTFAPRAFRYFGSLVDKAAVEVFSTVGGEMMGGMDETFSYLRTDLPS